MSVDVWFTQDIGQIITAAVRANEDALAAGLIGSDPQRQRAYHQGFRAALSTLALALGLPQLPPVDDREECTVVDSSVAVDEGWPPFDTAQEQDHEQALVLSGVGEEVSCGSRSPVVR
jgi:hypothetical protein